MFFDLNSSKSSCSVCCFSSQVLKAWRNISQVFRAAWGKEHDQKFIVCLGVLGCFNGIVLGIPLAFPAISDRL